MDKNENDDSSFDDGEEVYLGFGNTVTFYPVPWGTQRKMKAVWTVAFSARSSADIADLEKWQDAVCEVLHASASRGRPELTVEAMAAMIDSRNVVRCFQALRIASGVKVAPVVANGEAAPIRPTPAPRGDSSTPGSSQLQDGLLQTVTN